jgi:hypothetical protein
VVVGQRLQGVAPAQVDDPPVGVDAEHLGPAEPGPGQAARSGTPTLPASTEPAATSASIGVKSR